jgi:hypothetical protein
VLAARGQLLPLRVAERLLLSEREPDLPVRARVNIFF